MLSDPFEIGLSASLGVNTTWLVGYAGPDNSIPVLTGIKSIVWRDYATCLPREVKHSCDRCIGQPARSAAP
jgi:hypothetical protein